MATKAMKPKTATATPAKAERSATPAAKTKAATATPAPAKNKGKATTAVPAKGR